MHVVVAVSILTPFVIANAQVQHTRAARGLALQQTVSFQGLVNVSRQCTLTVISDRRGRAPSCYVDPRQAIDKRAACDELRPGQLTDQLI